MSELEKEALDKLRLSGKILRETREEIKNYVREGMPIIEICEKAENLIRNKGGKPAFPCNVSINEIAAHYTSPPNDTTKIPENSVVKVDIGAHVDGYLTDTAVTVCFNPEYTGLVETAERALKVAVENIRPGLSTSQLGSIIESSIKSRGFKPVSNLTGHQVGRYLVHTGTSLPNVAQLFSSKLKLGGTYAVEPFVTLPNAAGRVEDGDEAAIFRFVKSRSLKNNHARQLLKYIEVNFRTLPFAERWLQNVVPRENYREAFHELLSSKCLMQYPVFVEASGKTVAQAEHTVLLIEGGCSVLT
ncbi:MAG TPA: type II methionyl aminopeptidase [Candidatus Bathyarchaeia archaeon]|nr:type II methionyl aminopeptidase [Candidatus Bathyarchaeia archaeon]